MTKPKLDPLGNAFSTPPVGGGVLEIKNRFFTAFEIPEQQIMWGWFETNIRHEKDKSYVEGYKACGGDTGKQVGIAYVGFQEKLDEAHEQGKKDGIEELAELVDREVILPFGGSERKRQRIRLDEVRKRLEKDND